MTIRLGEPSRSPDMGSKPRRAFDVIEVEMDGELVLWRQGGMHRLDPVGAVVWRSLDGRTSLGELAGDLASSFVAPVGRVAADILALSRQLAGRGLLSDPFAAVEIAPPTLGSGPAVGPGPRPGPGRLASVREPWAYTTRRFRAVDFDFGVRSTDPAIGRYLENALGSLAAAHGDPAHLYSVLSDPGRPGYDLFLDELDLVTVDSPGEAVRRVLWHVNSEVIRRAGTHLLIHAAGAVLDDAAIVMPGTMNVGKTTLVAGLVCDGFGYLTDELVALNLRTGVIDPYPRPLNLETGSWTLLPELRPATWFPSHPLSPRVWHVDLGGIRDGALAEAAAPRFVIAPRFERGMEPRLEPFARGAALELLHDQAMNLQAHQAAGFEGLARMVLGSTCMRLVAGRLKPAIELVRQLVTNGHYP